MNRTDAIRMARGVHQEYGTRGTIRLVRVTWKHREVVKPTIRRMIES